MHMPKDSVLLYSASATALQSVSPGSAPLGTALSDSIPSRPSLVKHTLHSEADHSELKQAALDLQAQLSLSQRRLHSTPEYWTSNLTDSAGKSSAGQRSPVQHCSQP